MNASPLNPATEPENETSQVRREDVAEEQDRYDSVLQTPQSELFITKTSQSETTSGLTNGNRFLSAPLLSGPVRPLSPDTLSNLSADEYEQIRPARMMRAADHNNANHSPAPLRGWRSKLHAFYVHHLGLGYMLVAQVFGTLMNVTTRLLEVEGNNGAGMHPFQILFVRMGITFVLATGYMWLSRTPHFPLGMKEVRWLLVARGFGGFFGVYGMYYSLQYLPLADATVITFLAPGLACWVCSILLKEPFGRIEQLATFVSLIGVALIAKPTTLVAAFSKTKAPISGSPPSVGVRDILLSTTNTNSSSTMSAPVHNHDASNYDNVTPTQRLLAVLIALVGVLGATTAYTTIRWIGKRAHPLISVNYFAAWCTLVSTVMLLSLPDIGFQLPANAKEWGYLIFLGVCGFAMQFLLAAGLAYEKSSRATNITYTQMLFALSFDKIAFNHTPDLTSIAGSVLILGSAIVTATVSHSGKNQESKDQTNGRGATAATRDEEAQQGLLSGTADVESGEDHDRIPLQEIHVRTLR